LEAGAKKVWDAIVVMYTKIKTFIMGLFSKGESTADELEKAAEKAPDKESELSDKDKELVAGDLVGLEFYGLDVSAASIKTFVELQERVLTNTTDAKLVETIKDLSTDVSLLANTDAAKMKGELEKIVAGFSKTFSTVQTKDSLSAYGKIAKKTVESAIAKLEKEFKDGKTTVEFYQVGLTFKELIVIAKATNVNGDKTKFKSRTIKIKLDPKDIKTFVKENKKLKGLKKSEMLDLAKVYQSAGKTVKAFDKNVDAGVIAKAVKGILDDAEKAVDIKFDKAVKGKDSIDADTIKELKRYIDSVRNEIDVTFAQGLNAAAKTATDIANSPVKSYVRKSITKAAAKVADKL